MRKFLHIFLSITLVVSMSPFSFSGHVAEATEELQTYNNPMNGTAGANFTGAIDWLNERNAFDTVQPVTVAILDDGVDVSNPYIDENAFLTDECKSFIPGESNDTALNPPSYSNGHGTTMASVIGGKNGLGALSGVPGVNYISYRYYEYNDTDGKEKLGIDDKKFRPQLINALNSLFSYATSNPKGKELKVALITGAMSRAVKMILDESPNRIDVTKPRKTEMGENSIYYYDQEIGYNDKETESGFDDIISEDRQLETAILNLHNAGVSVVVAENNLIGGYYPGDDSTLSACPAFYDGALAVTAVNKKKEIASWPGQDYVRPDFTPNTDIAGYGSVDNERDWWVAKSGANATASHVGKTSGTSIAAAQVAAGIALTAKARSFGLSDDWTGVDAEDRIMDTYWSLDSLAGTKSAYNGAKGVLNVYKTIETFADSTHYHTFDAGWTSDETGHWHRCTALNCEQTNIKNAPGAEYAEHTFVDNKCTVCGYEREAEQKKVNISFPLATSGSFSVHIGNRSVSDGDIVSIIPGEEIVVVFSTTADLENNTASLVRSIRVNDSEVFNMNQYPTWNSFSNLSNEIQKERSSNIYTITDVDAFESLNVEIKVQGVVPVYRLYNELSSEHMSCGLGEYLIYKEKYEKHEDFWRPEGIGWFSLNGGKPVYRLYNRDLGDQGNCSHYYTPDRDWANKLISESPWELDGIVSYSEGSKPIYHAYSEALRSAHFYTSDLSEYRSLDGGWNKEPSDNGFKDEADIQVSVGTGMFKAVV